MKGGAMFVSETMKKEFKKYGITARKHGGDDCYSWAVFVNGRARMEGLGRSEVNYYKHKILVMEKERRGE